MNLPALAVLVQVVVYELRIARRIELKVLKEERRGKDFKYNKVFVRNKVGGRWSWLIRYL